jgi:hypothetical protein
VHLLLPIFGFPQKKIENEKIQKNISKQIFKRNPKIIGVRKGCWNAENDRN